MTFTKNWPDNKHKKNLRGARKSINSPRFAQRNPPKEHTEVSMDEVRQQALMMSRQGLAQSVQIKSSNVLEKPKSKGRLRATK